MRQVLPTLLTAMLLVAGCVSRIPTAPVSDLTPVAPAQVPNLTDDMALDGLAPAITQSLIYLRRLPPERQFRFGSDIFSRDHMIRSLERVAELLGSEDPARLARTLKAEFRFYRAAGRDDRGEVLFTGYYEPILQGCRQPGGVCRYPVYGRPNDLLTIDLSPFGERFAGQRIVGRFTGQTVVPYPDREAIDGQNVLAGKAPILAWVDDPVDLFFLQIQGSGRIALSEGGILGLRYAGSNGRPYRSIGRLLIERNEISAEAVSMQAIRAYLHTHPYRQAEVLAYNPSYVFFEVSEGGPFGSLGVPLTPGRSLAADPQHFPQGALALVCCAKPLTDDGQRIVQWTPFSRFMLNQDTGGAIRGPGRADLFWGRGPYAELAAGHLKHPGTLYFMVLNPGAG